MEADCVQVEDTIVNGLVVPLGTLTAALLLIVKLVFPVLVSVTFCDALVDPTCVEGKEVEAGRVACGPLPVPVRATVFVLAVTPLLLSATVRVADSLPITEGVKVTLTVQLAPAFTGLTQLFV